MSTFRQYTKDDSFVGVGNVQQIIPFLKEYQIALASPETMTRMITSPMKNSNPIGTQKRSLPPSIIQFKKENLKVNFFISIGDRDAKFPFKPIDKDSWISNATKSIKSIIRDNFQRVKDIVGIGIDVYDEHVNEEDEFAFCVGQLIKKLKEAELISVASISPSSNLQTHYLKLYQIYSDFIDLVDYLFYNEWSLHPILRA